MWDSWAETTALKELECVVGTDSEVYFKNVKIEKGNKATDWTPAPEDVDAAIDVVSSKLTSFKETTASKDSAQTIVNNQALSRINSAESSITSLQSTLVTNIAIQDIARTRLNMINPDPGAVLYIAP